MSFRKAFSKPTSPSAPKQATSTSLAGFSFKQLEEDEEEEDFIGHSGRREKLTEDSQKTLKEGHKRTPSTSSVSSTSSAADEIRSSEKTNSEGITENMKISIKSTSSVSTETASSPILTAAKAKFETSKDLFSGLRGKITDKISRTIEEFSGDSSSNSSPEKEKAKLLPLHKTSSRKPAEKKNDPVFHIAASNTEIVSSAPVKENAASYELQNKSSCSSLAHSESSSSLKEHSSSSLKENSSSSVTEISAHSSVKKQTLTSSQEENIASIISSDLVETHPLARSDVDDDFEDVIELSETELSRSKQTTGDDFSEFYDPHNEEIDIDILESGGKFASEPAEDFTGHPRLWKGVQLKSSSKVKCLVKKNDPKTPAVTTSSNLHNTYDVKCASSLGSGHTVQCKESKGTKVSKESKECEKNSSEDKLTSIPSKSATSVILQHLSLENQALPYQKLISIAVVLFIYLIVPLPSYVSGFIMGTLLASLGWALYMWLMEQPRLLEPVVLPPVNEAPLVPEMKLTMEGEEFLYKGWMNELTDYNPADYHINKTHSIFISLEGSHLRIQRPKNAIPKRAMWDEVLAKPQFIHQRHFDLPGSRVFLLPHGLVRKRIWSKKYPICIALANRNADDVVKLKHNLSEPILTEKAKMSDMGFEFVTDENCEHNVLYLFARTGREKEEWFRRFAAAASGKPLGNHVLEMKRVLAQSSAALPKSLEGVQRHRREGSTGSTNSSSSETPSELSSQKDGESLDLLTFAHYMGRLMPSGSLSGGSSPTHTTVGKDGAKSSDTKDTGKNSHVKDSEGFRVLNPGLPVFCDSQLFWLNAIIGRCFFDFLRDKWWIGKVKEKLQRKLSKIHVPYFIEELHVTDINMGCEIPGIRNASKPYIDERGFWVNLDITYAGGFQMTIETKMNLMKLKKTPHTSTHAGHSVDNLKSPVTDSDEEDSAESSTEEEEEVPSYNSESASGGGTSKKFLRYLNKITQSKYFQQATEYGVIKRAMENVSNTPLTLSVTVISLVGKMALNIPPPPSDRLWYGFRGNPHLRLSAKPQVGERAVTITHIVEWIEKKLATEFQRVFVMPNMDDLIIPILVPGEINGVALTHSVSM